MFKHIVFIIIWGVLLSLSARTLCVSVSAEIPRGLGKRRRSVDNNIDEACVKRPRVTGSSCKRRKGSARIKNVAAMRVQRAWRSHLCRRVKAMGVLNWDANDVLTLESVRDIPRDRVFVFDKHAFDALALLQHFTLTHEDPLTRGHVRSFERNRCRCVVNTHIAGLERLLDIVRKDPNARGNRRAASRLRRDIRQARCHVSVYDKAEDIRKYPQRFHNERNKLRESFVQRLAEGLGDTVGDIQDVFIHPDARTVDVTLRVDNSSFVRMGRRLHTFRDMPRPKPVPVGD